MDWEALADLLRRRGWIVAVCGVLGIVAAGFYAKKHHEFTAQSEVVLVAPNPNAQTPDVAQLTVQPSDLPTLAQSATVLGRVASATRFTGDPVVLRRQIRAHISLLSSIMPISFTASSPADAINGANAVADGLTDYYREISASRFTRLIDDLRTQMAARRNELQSVDARIATLAAANPYLDAKNGTAAVNAQIQELQSRRAVAQAAAEGDAAAAAVLADLLRDVRPLASSELAESSPAFRNIRDQYAKDAAELVRVRAAFSNAYPGLPELVDQTSREHRAMHAVEERFAAQSPLTSKSYQSVLDEKMTADAKVKNDLAQVAAFDRQIAESRGVLDQSGRQNSTIAALRRERDAAEASFAQLADRLTAARANRAAATSIGAISVIDRARFAQEGGWSKGAAGRVIFLLLGLWIGIGIAYGLDALDGRLRGRRQLEALYGAPVLTTIG